MCGDPYSRAPTIDSGDLIAIIHPNRPRSTTTTFSGARLQLSNKTPGSTVSSLKCNGRDSDSSSDESEDSDASVEEELLVRIHKHGQPLDREDTPNPVVHSFSVSDCDSSTAGMRLDLGVGGEGIVGRTVSIMDSRRRVLGEGVIGWG